MARWKMWMGYSGAVQLDWAKEADQNRDRVKNKHGCGCEVFNRNDMKRCSHISRMENEKVNRESR